MKEGLFSHLISKKTIKIIFVFFILLNVLNLKKSHADIGWLIQNDNLKKYYELNPTIKDSLGSLDTSNTTFFYSPQAWDTEAVWYNQKGDWYLAGSQNSEGYVDEIKEGTSEIENSIGIEIITKDFIDMDQLNLETYYNKKIDDSIKDIKTWSTDTKDTKTLDDISKIYENGKAIFSKDNYRGMYEIGKDHDVTDDGSFHYSTLGYYEYTEPSILEGGLDTHYAASGNNFVMEALVTQWEAFMIKTLGLYKQKNLNINPDILEKLDDEIDYLKDTKGFNGAYKELDDIELNPTDGHFVGANIQGVLFGYGSNKTIIDPDGIPIVDPVNTPPTNGANIPCNKTSLWGVINSDNPSCSTVAYLINLTLSGLNQIFNNFLDLVGELLDWSVNFSIYKFNDIVSLSGAYDVWRNVILALITSLLLPIVFYYIIRMLIDNDSSGVKKILPKILLTALFVYFSFSVVGWIIDQSNILSIYIYRSLSSSTATMPQAFKSLILGGVNGNTAILTSLPNNISFGSWSTVPVMLVQLLIVGTAIIVFFQATILIFVRGLTLTLCMIFSPLMLLPAGINKYLDKYRDMVITYFTNSTIMAPIFFFLVLIAFQIGATASQLTSSASITLAGDTSGVIGAALSGVIVIIVLEIALTTAKNLSGQIGTAVSGKISGVMGNVAFGGAGKIARLGMNKVATSKRLNKWIEKGGRGTYMAHRLLKYGQNSTFDLRNSKAFNSATGGSFGQGTGTTAKSSLDAKYRRRSDFHNRLNEGGQEKHLNYLKGYNLFSSKEVARRLEGKQRLNFDEKLNADKSFNKKFEKANKEADENKRLEKIKDIADEHFKENGKGKKYFTDALEKAENAKFKKDLEDANKETDERTRKEAISKVIKEFEEEEKKQNKNNSSGQQSGQQNTNQQNQNNTQGQAGNTTRTGTGTNTQTGSGINRNGPAPSVKNESAQNSLKNRLQAKYGDSEQVGLRSQLQKESAAANMRIETKARKEENQRYNSDQYQKQVLSDLEEKNRFKNMSEDTKRIREGIENLNKNFSEGLKEFNSSLLNNIKNSNSMSKNTTNSPNMSKVDGDDMIEKRTERNVNKKPTKDANENDYINNNNRNAA